MSRKLLVQVNCSFDLYICTALVIDKDNKLNADLLIPYKLSPYLPDYIRKSYDKIILFDPTIRNLFSIKALLSTFKIKKWAKSYCKDYQVVLFGAYRSDITSVLVKSFFGKVNFLTIKQGVDKPKSFYKPYKSLRELHDDIYYKLFGFSSFSRERFVQDSSCSAKSDFLFMRPLWKRDPFIREKNVFTLGTGKTDLRDGTQFFIPNFINIKKMISSTRRNGILLIGERTPMTPSWGQDQDILIKKIFSLLAKFSNQEQIFVRGRKGLTNNNFYSDLNPIYLDPDQLFDDQLLKLNPRLVISVKSTATKCAAFYGYPAYILYPSLNFENAECKHLDYLFGDGSPVCRIDSLGKLAEILGRAKSHYPESETIETASKSEIFKFLENNS